MRGLAREPKDRFATALELADALTQIVPPAYPTEVRRWVEDLAGAALAERALRVAEIETSRVVSASNAHPEPAREPSASESEASQPSGVLLERPKNHAARRRRTALAATLGISLAAAAMGTAVWRTTTARPAAGMHGDPSSAIASFAEAGPLETASATPVASAPALSTSTSLAPSVVAPRPVLPSRPTPPPKPHSGPKPVPSIRFAEPD
jgi:serine/threonine-protein kinase